MSLTQVTLRLAEVTLQPNLGLKAPLSVLKADKLKHDMSFRGANKIRLLRQRRVVCEIAGGIV